MSKYTTLQILLHWTIFVLVVVQFVFHDAIVQAFDALLMGTSRTNGPLVSAHLAVGGMIGILTALRLWVRIENGVPEHMGNHPKLFDTLANFVHFSFYGILLLLAITGGYAWYQGSQGAANAHSILRAALLILILIHVAAACVHLIVWRQNIIKRMLPSRQT